VNRSSHLGAVLDRLRVDAVACHAAAVAAVEPGRRVRARLADAGGMLVLRCPHGNPVATHAGPVVLVGAGKASVAMARAAAAVVGPRLRAGCVLAPPGTTVRAIGPVTVAAAGHPVPDAAGEAATRHLLDVVRGAPRDTLVVALLSGGASAMLVAPASGCTLADKQALTAALLAAGAEIAALNCIRKHCSGVKGGGLARAAAGAAGVWALVLSDVVGDDLATIASGPTVADPTTFADATTHVQRHLSPAAIPPAIAAHLARGRAGAVSETVKPGDPVLARVRTVLVGGNRDAVAAAAEVAAARGYATTTLAEPLVGDAAAAARLMTERLRTLPRDRPVALVAGGETTVRVVPGGTGGRSQHLALAAVTALAGEPAVLLAAGTDGVDGPTDAAGACVDGETLVRAAAVGRDVPRALALTDSHPVLAATGDLLRTGPTGTNVADLVVTLRAAC